jgi:hypothetical protein
MQVRIVVSTSYDVEVPEGFDARQILEWAHHNEKIVPNEIVDGYSEVFDTDGNRVE